VQAKVGEFIDKLYTPQTPEGAQVAELFSYPFQLLEAGIEKGAKIMAPDEPRTQLMLKQAVGAAFLATILRGGHGDAGRYLRSKAKEAVQKPFEVKLVKGLALKLPQLPEVIRNLWRKIPDETIIDKPAIEAGATLLKEVSEKPIKPIIEKPAMEIAEEIIIKSPERPVEPRTQPIATITERAKPKYSDPLTQAIYEEGGIRANPDYPYSELKGKLPFNLIRSAKGKEGWTMDEMAQQLSHKFPHIEGDRGLFAEIEKRRYGKKPISEKAKEVVAEERYKDEAIAFKEKERDLAGVLYEADWINDKTSIAYEDVIRADVEEALGQSLKPGDSITREGTKFNYKFRAGDDGKVLFIEREKFKEPEQKALEIEKPEIVKPEKPEVKEVKPRVPEFGEKEPTQRGIDFEESGKLKFKEKKEIIPKKGEELTAEQIEQLKKEGKYEDLGEAPKEKPLPEITKEEVEPAPAREKLVKVSVKTPTGKIEDLGNITLDRLEKVKARAKSLGLENELTVGEPYTGKWKEFYSPKEHEKFMLEMLQDVKEKPKETWEKWQSGDTLGGMVDELDATIKEKQKGEYPKAGMGVKLTKRIPKEKPFSFTDAEVERSFRASRGLTRRPISEMFGETFAGLKNKITRTYEYLPNTKENIKAKTALKRLEKQRGVTHDKAARILQGITAQQGRKRYDIFSRKVLLDDLQAEARLGHDLPFGFTNDMISKELTRLDAEMGKYPEVPEAISSRSKVWEALRKDYTYWMKEIDMDVEGRFTKDKYFRHQVLEHARAKSALTTGKRLRTPTGRSFLRERKGSKLDINTDYLQAESEVMTQMLYDIEVAKTLKRIEPYSIHEKVYKDAKAKGLKDWRKTIPDGYRTFQPREGNHLYLADTIPERLAKKIMEDSLTDIGVVKDALTKALSIGAKHKEWVIPDGLAKTLENLVPRNPNWLGRGSKKALRAWKVWTLTSPRRYFKYNIRNLTGDADAAFVGNTSGFKKVPRAIHNLYDLFVLDKPMTKEMKGWFERGGMETTLQAQEISKLRIFKDLHENKGKLKDLPETAWKKYWRAARISTDFREAVLRYANYLDYLEQIKKSPEGRPKNFGASLREEIMGLKDPRDKAFRLSNELLGAYDEISVLGQAIREHIYPFWSWKELNFRRYIRLFKNAAADHRLASTTGKTLLKGVAYTPLTALRVGKFAIKATAFSSMLQVWNNLMFPEEEASLTSEQRGRPHIILGTDKNGKVINFTRIGALGDFLEWFGLDAAPHLVSSYLNGRKSVKEIANEMARAPVNQVVQGITPFIKYPVERFTRRSLFPDVFKPRTIRNRGLHIARSLGLENEYKAVMDVPSEPYKESLPMFFAYKSDPMASAYHEIWNLKNEYQKETGKAGEGFYLTSRSNALYNLKLARRYGDTKLEKKYLKEYIGFHLIEMDLLDKSEAETKKSIKKGLEASFRNMHPLSGLNKKAKESFQKNLSPEQKDILVLAIKYYNDILVGTSDIDIDEILNEEWE